MPRRARGAVVIKKGKQQILERSALENLAVLPLFMISVVILESRSPGSVVLTKGGHPELAARRVFRIYRLVCLLWPFGVVFLKCFYIKFVVN